MTAVDEIRDEHLGDAIWLVRGRPLWIVSGQLGIVIFLLVGFSSVPEVKPNVFVVLLLACIAAMVATSPAGRTDRTPVFIVPIVVLTWMFLSVIWTYNEFGWRRDAELLVPAVLAAMTLFGMLPVNAVYRALVVGCQVVIGWTVLYTILNPGIGMNHSDGTSGWTGGFGHKNALAPFMVLAIIVIANLEKDRRRRNISVVGAAAFIVLSQSTTILAIGMIMIPFVVLIIWALRLDAAGRATTFSVAINVIVLSTLGLTLAIEQLLASRGKDLTLSSRTEIWLGVWQAIESEFWLGYGMGGVWIDQGAEPTASIVRPLGFTVFHSHNGFLEVWLQFGLIGLCLVLLLFVLLLRSSIRLLTHSPDHGLVAMLFVVLATLTSLSEVLFLGNWLAMASGLYVLTRRHLRELDPDRRHEAASTTGRRSP